MTHRETRSANETVMHAIDHFNRRSSADALRGHGRDEATRFEVGQIVQLGSEVRTRGDLVNRAKELRLSLVLAWKFDAGGRLARIEAYPIEAATATPLAATRNQGRRRFPKQGFPDALERLEHA